MSKPNRHQCKRKMNPNNPLTNSNSKAQMDTYFEPISGLPEGFKHKLRRNLPKSNPSTQSWNS